MAERRQSLMSKLSPIVFQLDDTLGTTIFRSSFKEGVRLSRAASSVEERGESQDQYDKDATIHLLPILGGRTNLCLQVSPWDNCLQPLMVYCPRTEMRKCRPRTRTHQYTMRGIPC